MIEQGKGTLEEERELGCHLISSRILQKSLFIYVERRVGRYAEGLLGREKQGVMPVYYTITATSLSNVDTLSRFPMPTN